MPRYLDDFTPKRRPIRSVAQSLKAGDDRSVELMADLELARRAGKAIQPVVKQMRLAIDFENPGNCRIDPEQHDRLILFAKNSVQHSRLRNLTTTLLSRIMLEGLPIMAIAIRIRPEKSVDEEAQSQTPQPRRGSISGAARLRAAARTGIADEKLAALFERLADAVEPRPERESIDLYDSLDALIASARAGVIAAEQLKVRLPKAPDEKLIPSEKAAARAATVAELRRRMIERLENRRRFERPIMEAEAALKREAVRARALLAALKSEAEALSGISPDNDATPNEISVFRPLSHAKESLSMTMSVAPREAEMLQKKEEKTRARLEAALSKLPIESTRAVEEDYLALDPEVRKSVRTIAATAAALEAYEARRLRDAAKPLVVPEAPKTPEEVLEGSLESIARIVRAAKNARASAETVLDRLSRLPRYDDETFAKTRMPRRLLTAEGTDRLAQAARTLREDVSRLLFRLDEERSRLESRTRDPLKPEFADAIIALEALRPTLSDEARMLGEEGETLVDRIELLEAEAASVEARLQEMADADAKEAAKRENEAVLPRSPSQSTEADPKLTLEARLAALRVQLDQLLQKTPQRIDAKLIPSENDAAKNPMLAGVRARLLKRSARAEAIHAAADQAIEKRDALNAAVAAGFQLDESMLASLDAAIQSLQSLLANLANPTVHDAL